MKVVNFGPPCSTISTDKNLRWRAALLAIAGALTVGAAHAELSVSFIPHFIYPIGCLAILNQVVSFGALGAVSGGAMHVQYTTRLPRNAWKQPIE